MTPRVATCRTCAATIPAGRRGPLPRRCPACRARPVLPERTSGDVPCARCRHPVPVRGRRGPLPRTCWWCRRGRRRLADLTPTDWAAVAAARVETP